MAYITPAQLSFNGKQVQALSEAIMTASFLNQDIKNVLTLRTGVKQNEQIALLGRLGLSGKVQLGCEPATNPSAITMSEKMWAPKYIEDRFVECWKAVVPSFFGWGLKNGVMKADLTNTDYANMLEERIAETMTDAIWRITFFGDTTHSPVGDATGNQLLKTGTDKTYFNMLDGIWKQLFAIGTATAARKSTGLTALNAGISYAAQAFTPTDVTNKTVTALFTNMVTGSTSQLRKASDKKIFATQSVVDQYIAERMSFGSIEMSYKLMDDGISRLMFQGIEVVEVAEWDNVIRTYFDNGTKFHLPHRAILASKENLQFATEEESNLSELNPFYDQKTKAYYADFGFTLDAKVIEDNLVQLAY